MNWYDNVEKYRFYDVSEMKVSQDCIDLIEHFEGKRNKAYLDPVGIPTIGIGFIQGVKMGHYMTDEEIYVRLKDELERFEKGVKNSVNIPLTQGMFDACVSFSYNLGNGAFARSTLLKKLNLGDIEGASEEFGKWVNAGGKKLLGLQRRRDAERLMFLGKDWKSYKREWS